MAGEPDTKRRRGIGTLAAPAPEPAIGSAPAESHRASTNLRVSESPRPKRR